LVTVDRARVWSLPDAPPPLVGAAVSAATARTVGGWADGLITINQPLDDLRRVIGSFRDAGGESKPVYVQVHLSWDPDPHRALDVAWDQWRSNVFPSTIAWNLELPEQFDAISQTVRPEDVLDSVVVSADPRVHCERLLEIAQLGVDGIYLHHVGQQQDAFIDTFAEHVLPTVRACR
jgi:alkanesulfonate monooxygenase SsuD/methylene tetrahydromethanopterin reductase-like flavin-dependent oxidoreductase (luciferase family)